MAELLGVEVLEADTEESAAGHTNRTQPWRLLSCNGSAAHTPTTPSPVYERPQPELARSLGLHPFTGYLCCDHFSICGG